MEVFLTQRGKEQETRWILNQAREIQVSNFQNEMPIGTALKLQRVAPHSIFLRRKTSFITKPRNKRTKGQWDSSLCKNPPDLLWKQFEFTVKQFINYMTSYLFFMALWR